MGVKLVRAVEARSGGAFFNMTSQGRLFRACRGLLRICCGRYRCEGNVSGEAVVYVCRHRYAIGPVLSLCCLPTGIRPWVLSTFFEKDECRRHCVDYTFSLSWGLPKWLARVMASVICPAFTALVHSAAAIPVYRNSLKVRETFVQSIAALEDGESLLIFPDVNYTTVAGDTGRLYDGFLLLEQLWQRKTHNHVRFVPIHISTSRREMYIGAQVSFSGDKPFGEEKREIVERLEHIFDEMAKEYGT